GASRAGGAREGGGRAAVPSGSGGAALEALPPRGSTTVAWGRPATEEAIGVGVGGSVAASATAATVDAADAACDGAGTTDEVMRERLVDTMVGSSRVSAERNSSGG